MAGHVVATVDQIPPGQRKLVEVGGRAIVIYNLAGAFFALANRCPHRGGSLFDGIQTGLVESTEPGRYSYSRPGEMVKCPWHGWEFDIRTGKSVVRPVAAAHPAVSGIGPAREPAGGRTLRGGILPGPVGGQLRGGGGLRKRPGCKQGCKQDQKKA
jgi:3-phenylpropionate/trans-cinnamate dioxygenase ferredoxin subunit